jgi:uncharacterized protein YjbJ (UPF0337 family)
MNPNQVEEPWHQIKSEILSVWNQITGDDLELTRGHFMSITGLIQEKYVHEKDVVTEKLLQIFRKFGQSTESIQVQFEDAE